MPIVSVLMTAYNREKYIAEAIDSVIESGFEDFELIIVDDCSTDSTVEIVKDYVVKDARVKLYQNGKNLGDYANRNEAASFAKGKYLKYVDSDDKLCKDGLLTMVNCMEQFPSAALGICISQNDRSVVAPSLIKPEDAYVLFYFASKLIIMGPTNVIIRRDVFNELGGFSGKPYVGDTEMWYKFAALFPIISMPSDLTWWREHDGQQIKKEQQNALVPTARFQLTIDALLSKHCPLQPLEKNMALRNMKNNFSRKIIMLTVKGRFKRAVITFSKSSITFIDLLLSLNRNQYPDTLNQLPFYKKSS